jgi:CheY-like chemotaxis protein
MSDPQPQLVGSEEGDGDGVMPPNRSTGRPLRILIVDDEQANRELLAAMLSPENFELVMATTGQEALDAMMQQIPDVVLLDIMMPGMNGYQVTAKIREVPGLSHIPVIILSSLEDDNTRTFALNAGADAVMPKRVPRLDLLDRMRQLLDLRA